MSNDYPDIAKRKGAHQTLSFPNQTKLLTLKEEDYLQKHRLYLETHTKYYPLSEKKAACPMRGGRETKLQAARVPCNSWALAVSLSCLRALHQGRRLMRCYSCPGVSRWEVKEERRWQMWPGKTQPVSPWHPAEPRSSHPEGPREAAQRRSSLQRRSIPASHLTRARRKAKARPARVSLSKQSHSRRSL